MAKPDALDYFECFPLALNRVMVEASVISTDNVGLGFAHLPIEEAPDVEEPGPPVLPVHQQTMELDGTGDDVTIRFSIPKACKNSRCCLDLPARIDDLRVE